MSDVDGLALQDNGEHDIELLAQADIINLLFKQSFPAVIISIINASLVLLTLWRDVDQHKLLIWYGLVVSASTLRTALFIKFRIQSPGPDAIGAWESPYFFTLVISALVWGLGGLWLIVGAPAEAQLTIYFFLIGMAGGAISVYSSIWRIVLTALLIVLLPTTSYFLVFGDGAVYFAAVGSSFFLISCIRTTKVLATALHQSFLLAHQLNQAKNRAEVIARTDYLTGLYNRGAFHELAETQMAYCKRHKLSASLIALDLDDFKKINDTFGHAAGDDALRHIGRLLLRSSRSSDICGRMGGEEFVIFLPNTALNDAVIVAEKIRDVLNGNSVQLGTNAVCITASLGVASGVFDLNGLFSCADQALYRAKASGKNRVDSYLV